MIRIALFQSQTGIDPAANAARLADAIEQAAAGGAAMLFTPEMSGLLDRDAERAAQMFAWKRMMRCSPRAATRRTSTASGSTSARSRCARKAASSPTARS